MTIVMIACTIGLLLAGITFIGWEQRVLRNNMVQNLSIQAAMIADNSKAALAFRDPTDAEKTLDGLHVDPSIVFGGIYTQDGKLFAAYYRGDSKIEIVPSEYQETGFAFKDGFLTVTSPIVLDKEVTGTVCLRMDLAPMYAMLKRNIQIMIIVLILSSLAAFLVSSRLQTVISKPILSLAELAKAVSEKKDYSSRAMKQSNDEVGLLIDAFNEMLEQIQKRDSELLDAKEGLEIKVEERTLEITKANEQMIREIDERKKAQDELSSLLSLHSATLESTADGILVVDLNGKVVSHNQKFLHLWQIPASVAETKIDNKLLEFVFDQLSEPEKFIAKVKRLYANPFAQSQDILYFKDNRVYERCSQPQRIGNRVVGRVWTFRDITERKLAEQALKQSQQMLQLVMDNVPQSIFWKDRNLNYLGCNVNFAKDAGLAKPGDIVGKSDYDLAWKKEEANAYCEDDKKVMDSNTPKYHIIEQQQQASGKTAWLDTNKVPLHDINGNVVGILGSYSDITERKEAEEEKDKLTRNLEDANQQMKNFVYIASHDLREPLRKISAFGDMLQTSLKGKLEKDDTENLQFMIDGAQRMNKMIERLLVYSKVSTKSQPPETVDLNEIVKQLQQLELSMVLQEKQVTVEVPQPLPAVEVDPVQIRQLIQNLIANGIKYQEKGTIPHITITSKSASDGMVRVDVKDNGIGIKPEYQQAVFTMFKRLHARNEYEGTGIGLAVCKKIVERHGGQIGVESEFGKGCTFWFTVPAAGKPVTADKAINT
ncbi:MAG: PAS domain-containing protein [Planctomycetes bacterium]|nr:PAS domain-containing protein [Planctomycetota bacterium]